MQASWDSVDFKLLKLWPHRTILGPQEGFKIKQRNIKRNVKKKFLKKNEAIICKITMQSPKDSVSSNLLHLWSLDHYLGLGSNVSTSDIETIFSRTSILHIVRLLWKPAKIVKILNCIVLYKISYIWKLGT